MTPGPAAVVIAEDETLSREALCELVGACAGWRVSAVAHDGVEALGLCLGDPPALLISDVRMPRLDGLDLAAELRAANVPTEIVFVTAFDDYALSAFRVAALDYLLKPIDDRSVHDCLARVRARLDASLRSGEPGALEEFLQERRASMRHLAVRSTGRVEVVPLDRIVAIRAQGNYAELVGATRAWLHRETMTSLSGRLDPARFVKIHRSAIVAIAHVERIERSAAMAAVLLDNGLRVRASPHGARLLERMIGR